MTSVVELKDNEIKVIAALNNNYKLERDVSLGSYDGEFHPIKLYGVKITKKLLQKIQRCGFIKVQLEWCLGTPSLRYTLTTKGKRFIEYEVHDA